MSEEVSKDGQCPGTPTRDLLSYNDGHDHLQNHDQQRHDTTQDFVDSGDGEGTLSATDDDNRKMSQDSLISSSLRGSPLLRPTIQGRYQDSDSCPSVSPSPDPDTQLRTFDFSLVDVSDEGESISAALQTEREFLDFMLSLPQAQKEAPGRTPANPPQKDSSSGQPPQETEAQPPPPPEPPSEHRSPTRAPPPTNVGGSGGLVGTKMGLDHLDNLCRMMEQLGELKEQNTRLQRRVHYLEELQTLQEMHRHLQETLEARRSGLGLGPIHLSDSDLHLDLDGDGEGVPGGELSQHGSDESLLLLTHHHHHHHHHPPHKDQFLEPPESPGRRHSSSEDDRRAATLERDDRGRPHDKEKKGHRSAWGKVNSPNLILPVYVKVKNMISTRRDSVRKKSSSSSSSHRKSTSERPGGHESTGIGIAVEVSAASDPEDYEVDYDGVTGEGIMDPGGGGGGGGVGGGVGAGVGGGGGGGAEAHETDWENGSGIWVGGGGGGGGGGPEESTHLNTNNSLGVRRSKPQLTITVPSSENLSLLQEGGERSRPPQRSPETAHRKVSPAQMELRTSPCLPMTPPSPRRASNWTKVKKAFLTSQLHHHHHQQQQGKMEMLSPVPGVSSSLPPSPSKKTSFQFEGPHLLGVETSPLEDSDSPCASVEVSPEDVIPPGTNNATPSPQPNPVLSPQALSTLNQQQGVQMNIADLQKSLSGEFNRRLQEWEKLKSGSGQGGPTHPPLSSTSSGNMAAGGTTTHPEDNLPHEFRKKLHEWEKIKEREREKVKVDMPRGQEDVKTKIHGEDDLPADFKKKLTEWKIRKALVGKSQQNVEELQKNLGEEFNRKMAEWERIKAASAHQGQAQVKPSASAGNIQIKAGSPPATAPVKSAGVISPGPIKQSASAGQVLVKPVSPGLESTSPRLDRKGSGHKIKKIKTNKTEKVPLNKTDGGMKGRYKTDKELQWLEKELHKVERETQRLEREKEKFLERQARLEKMRQAMGQGPAAKKEIYIKTSTGEFRFEGISQTFTKKLYEWEERRGIRPESSTIALLDPNYKAPEKEVQEKPKSPELMRLVRSKSESSVAADLVITSANSHPSSLSLNEMDQEEGGLQAENKAASEPMLAGDECTSPKVAVLVQLEEVVEEIEPPPSSLHHSSPTTPYAPAEITRNIDSSGSEEDVTRRKRADHDDDMVTGLNPMDGSRCQGSYRSLLQENMSLLDKLRQKEDLCRALEHQMGDIDSKMDNVADQHLRTLEKLHRQVTIIMKDSSSAPNDDDEGGGDATTANDDDDPETNQRLINHLRARIAELEMRGDHLKDEKEQLEMAFKLHKEQETEIAESLVIRIRELQDAGAEVNIQTVHCQTDDLPNLVLENSSTTIVEPAQEEVHEEIHEELEVRKEEIIKEPKEIVVKKVEGPSEKREHRQREHRKTKKAPPKKVQKLHNLTGDLLFQAKRLEQALVSKHGLDRRSEQQRSSGYSNAHRQRSLRGRSSLRLVGDSGSSQRRQRETTARTWSSIEAITVPSESPPHVSGSFEGGTGEGQEASSGATGGLVTSSRSLRLPSSVHSSCDPQDLLAMNAELSRMAKELRVEMMKMWSFRESTSPESETSESIDRRSMEGEQVITETDLLVAEANEVFQSIALLQKDGSPPSPHAGRSPSTHSRRSPSTTSLSKRRGSAGFEEKGTRRSADRDRSRSTTGTPSRRDSYRQQHQRQQYEEEDEEDDEEEEDARHKKEKDSVFLPVGSTLDDLLKRTQLEDDGRDWEGGGGGAGRRRRSSDGLSTVTSGPSRSHSPSPSIASSAPEAEVSPRLDDEDETISLSGTWKTGTTSTIRSGEHMLSSSFEWEDEEVEERRRIRGKWKAVVEEEEEDEEEDNRPHTTKSLKTHKRDASKSFETEVTIGSPRNAIRELRTRRISDTQVEYDSYGQGIKDECFAYTFSRTVYDDEALTAGRLSRNPSVRRANSHDTDDAHWWRRLRWIPSTISQDVAAHSDKSPDIFVPTKRTIFTVQGGALHSDQARATPTFVDNQDESTADIEPNESHPHITTKEKPQTTTTATTTTTTTSTTTTNATVMTTTSTTTTTNINILTKHKVVNSVNDTSDSLRKDVSSQLTKSTNQSTKNKNATSTCLSKEHTDESETTKVKNEAITNVQSTTHKEVQASQDGQLESLKPNNAKEISQSDKASTNFNDEEIKLLESEALDVPVPLRDEHSPRSSRQLTPVQLPSHTPMVAMLFQMSPPTSPPIESKRKVLEAVNEGVPTVRNIIQKFNQRITENQELLGSPFRSPPTSPPWQSPRSQRKLLANIAQASQMKIKPQLPGASPVIINPASGVLKSLSTSIIVNTEIPQLVQRSASSSLVQNDCSGDKNHSTTTPIPATSPKIINSNAPSTNDLWSALPTVTPVVSPIASPAISPAVSPVPTDLDTSYDLDISIDESALASQDRITSSPQPGEKSPSGRLRAIKIKKAKEEFLARGAAPLVTEQRLGGGNESVKLRRRSGTASTDDSWRDSGEISGGSPSPFPSLSPGEETSIDREETPDRPPKTAARRSKVLKKESFRRQSAGCLLEESTTERTHVVKSASSGVLGRPETHFRQSIDSESQQSRKASVDPSTDSGKTSRGFFKIFRRRRNRDKKDMPSVQRLCRQSLLVDFAGGRGRTQSASPQPGCDSHLFALPEMDGEDSPDAARSSKTLPRGGSGEAVPPAPSRSCPSSPVAPHRSRTANWLVRGRQIFKSRSPSPNKKAR